MSKLKLAGLTSALAMLAGMASANDPVTLQLKWVTQGQFAGYYVALDNGYYEDEGLDVTILPGGPDLAPVQVLMGGGADVMVDWMPSALAAREQGALVVNIAQPVARSGLMLVCWADSGIATPEDFRGHRIGTWFFGNEIPLLNWLSQLGIPTTGGEDGVEILRIGFSADPLLQRQADCITAMTYNEYWQVMDAGVTPDQLVIFRYDDYGVSTLEDGLYVNEANLSDPAFVDRMARFVRASMRGWQWALANPEAAAEIVLDNDETGAQTMEHQVRMVREMALLTEGSTGELDEAAYQRTVDTLLGGGSDPVITRAPEGAWTHVVTDAAMN
ncbi:MAG TPA: ABC transporter substrate-binding protein [Pararhodobacter sp.]|uniref:ABC transporter substrate-binding protein n=1 Tax=Pararhodobacter sp. TaxID=2127056 RepID=UPI002BF4836B|nr:ABC transporter substrate-binding protein [Pararhodobacter sp.]HPD93794.1 ABC transporter substrate-binding protein [Pararhodobacter sp.]